MLKLPHEHDVSSWQLENIDIWPLFATSLVGLALHCQMGFRRGATSVGDPLWKAGILADYFVVSPLKALVKNNLQSPDRLPPDDLAECILMIGSKDHTRQLEDIFLLPVLDVPAIKLRRSGRQTVSWISDAHQNDPALNKALQLPTHGIGNLLRAAKNTHVRKGTSTQLHKLKGFSKAIKTATSFIPLSERYLNIWFTRQADFMLAANKVYGEVFDHLQHPAAIVMTASGYWWSSGLIAAARARAIPVIEAEHGAERLSAITAPAQLHHFSSFNSAPEALISWSLQQTSDPHILSTGPIGNLLPALLREQHSSDPSGYDRLQNMIENQSSALRHRANATQFQILISSEAGISHDWIAELLALLPNDYFCWIRRHPAEKAEPVAAYKNLDRARYDTELASQVLLPLLLDRVDLHVTRFSALTLEAAAMGVPTLATQNYAKTLFADKVPAPLLLIETEPSLAAKKIIELSEQKTHKEKPLALDTFDIPAFIEDHIEASKRQEDSP